MSEKSEKKPKKEKVKSDAPTPGAGVDPVKVCVPTKRLKNAHRKALKAGHRVSLKDFVRSIEDGELAEFGIAWLDNKKPSATAEARKAHRDRVSTLRAMKPPKEKKGKKK